MRIDMRNIIIALAGATLLSSGAAAFQVQEKSVAPAGQAAPAAPVAPGPVITTPAGKPELKLDLPEGGGSGATGTEIRIPGLGKLGVIPKMDFGLELLYGANEKGRAEPEVNTNDSKDGELAIRGSIRHRF
ncbi:MAG: hypothetical protein AB7F74_27100 [Parvibaculaceae bacterium]